MYKQTTCAAIAALFGWAGVGLAQQQPETLTLAVSDTYGPYIVGPEGRPVYTMLTKIEAGDDQDPLNSCNEACRDNWPVLSVKDDNIRVGDGLDPDLAATVAWHDMRVPIYADRALFLFHRDSPGKEPEGQGIFSFGGYWALLSPSGEPIRTDAMPEANFP